MEHLDIWIRILLLLFGSAILVVLYNQYSSQKYRPLFLIFLLTLLGNASVLLDTLNSYIQINLFESLLHYKSTVLENYLEPINGFLLFLMLYNLLLLKGYYDKHGENEVWKRLLILCLVVYVIANTLLITHDASITLLGVIFYINSVILLGIIGTALYILLFFIITGLKKKNNEVYSIGLFYFLILVFLILTHLLHPLDSLYSTALIFSLFNLFPIFWLQYSGLTKKMTKQITFSDTDIERFAETYSLTARQKDIMKLIIEGKSNKEISELLFIAEHTVKNHIYQLFQKLKIKNRYQLINMFVTNQQIVTD